eukprot:3900285-Lingulodinium_polyedra.AAC.1
MPCKGGSASRPVPAQYLTMPRLSPEQSAAPAGHTPRRRTSTAARATQASATHAVAHHGSAR